MTESLTIRRVVPAPPARVFAAWTTPALLRRWWGPPGVICTHAEVDLRVGGAYRIDNQLPDGRVLTIRGTFEAIDEPRELVYSWQIGDEPVSRVIVRFAAFELDRCEVSVTHERVHSIAARDDHGRGWVGCLDGLVREFARAPGRTIQT